MAYGPLYLKNTISLGLKFVMLALATKAKVQMGISDNLLEIRRTRSAVEKLSCVLMQKDHTGQEMERWYYSNGKQKQIVRSCKLIGDVAL